MYKYKVLYLRYVPRQQHTLESTLNKSIACPLKFVNDSKLHVQLREVPLADQSLHFTVSFWKFTIYIVRQVTLPTRHIKDYPFLPNLKITYGNYLSTLTTCDLRPVTFDCAMNEEGCRWVRLYIVSQDRVTLAPDDTFWLSVQRESFFFLICQTHCYSRDNCEWTTNRTIAPLWVEPEPVGLSPKISF